MICVPVLQPCVCFCVVINMVSPCSWKRRLESAGLKGSNFACRSYAEGLQVIPVLDLSFGLDLIKPQVSDKINQRCF